MLEWTNVAFQARYLGVDFFLSEPFTFTGDAWSTQASSEVLFQVVWTWCRGYSVAAVIENVVGYDALSPVSPTFPMLWTPLLNEVLEFARGAEVEAETVRGSKVRLSVIPDLREVQSTDQFSCRTREVPEDGTPTGVVVGPVPPDADMLPVQPPVASAASYLCLGRVPGSP